MKTALRHAAGSLLVVGLAGTELTPLERAWLRPIRPAGIILFRRNIADARQTRTLLQEATALATPGALRCIDVEGGTVDRLRDALAPLPSAQAAARAGLGREHGDLAARAVQAFGFNLTLAPVLDLALPVSASVLGARASAPTPMGVVLYAREFLAGLAAHGIAGCAKHFPGLGAGSLDSHLATPSIERNFRTLWAQDLQPYRALAPLLPMVMVSHAAYPQTSGGPRPASVSRYWMETVLRRRIGFRGLVFSDDLEMGGILNFLSIEEAAVEAIRAGADLIEICHSPELILRAWEALLSEAERSPAFARLLEQRARRAAAQRKKHFTAAFSPTPSLRNLEALRNRIRRFTARVNQAQNISQAQNTSQTHEAQTA